MFHNRFCRRLRCRPQKTQTAEALIHTLPMVEADRSAAGEKNGRTKKKCSCKNDPLNPLNWSQFFFFYNDFWKSAYTDKNRCIKPRIWKQRESSFVKHAHSSMKPSQNQAQRSHTTNQVVREKKHSAQSQSLSEKSHSMY